MHFKELGEEGFIRYLANQFPSSGSIIGIGDDCAVIPGVDEKSWLVTVDALIEGVHFLKEEISPKDLGHKTVAVSVSDITAMGGNPTYGFLSIALPKTIEPKWAREVIQGMKEACEKWGILLLGGDTVGSRNDIYISLTLMGTALSQHIKYRHLAHSSDLICVSGWLGNAGAGLKALQNSLKKTPDVDSLIHSHFHPEPNVKHGLWLGAQTRIHAMMDISDGLDCDLKRLLESSQKGAVVEVSKLPISPALKRVCEDNQWDPLELALTGGEDYCLLFTVSPEDFESIHESFQKSFGQPLYPIGHLVSYPLSISYHLEGKEVPIKYANFDHFQ